MSTPKSIFVSHGAPDLVLAGTAATQFLKGYGTTLARPSGIIMVSAHHETEIPEVVSDPQPEMIYDFGGFDPALRELVYPAPGSPHLALKVRSSLADAGIESRTNTKRGFDHGAWVPLMLMFPAAAVPVVQLSVQPHRDAQWHIDLGKALAPLTEQNILIIGSGSLTHDLPSLFKRGLPSRDAPMPAHVEEFASWIQKRLMDNDFAGLANYRAKAPQARQNHPTEEHLHPLFVAAGVAMALPSAKAERIHHSAEFGLLAMDAYAFS